MNIFEKHAKLTTIILILVGLLVLLSIDRVLAGIFLRNSIRIQDLFFHHALLPNSYESSKWGNDMTYTFFTNSLGFKDKENRDVELTTNKYRIVFIGDSFTEGVGYPYEKTFVGYINSTLDSSKYDVLNAGVISYSPKLYFLKMKTLIEDTGLKMNELVCFIDISDIQDEIVYEDFQPENQLSYKNSLKNYIQKKSLIGNSALALQRKVIAWMKDKRGNKANNDEKFDRKDFDENYYKERSLWTDNDIVMKKWGNKGMALCEQYMDQLYLLMRKNNIKMTIAVYPYPYQITKKDMDSKQVKFWKKFSKDRDIDFIDYFPHFIRSSSSKEILEKYFIPGDCHWNAEGHKLVAKVYIDFFKRNTLF